MHSIQVLTRVVVSFVALIGVTPVQANGIDSVSLTFYTSPNNDRFHQTFPTDLTTIPIENQAPVTHIYNPGGAYCIITGIQGETVNVPIGDHKLETPQPLKSGFCDNL